MIKILNIYDLKTCIAFCSSHWKFHSETFLFTSDYADLILSSLSQRLKKKAPSLACPCPPTGLSYPDQGPGAYVSLWAQQGQAAQQDQETAGLQLPTALLCLVMGPAQT